MILTGNSFWKPFGQADVHGLLKMWAFDVPFCVLAKHNLLLRFGVCSCKSIYNLYIDYIF